MKDELVQFNPFSLHRGDFINLIKRSRTKSSGVDGNQ